MLPRDPNMLFSMINMKLRDFYSSFDELVDDLDEDKAEIIDILSKEGYNYDAETNQFR